MLKYKRSNENLQYMLCLIPLMGVAVGAALYVFNVLCLQCGFGQSCYAFIGAVIPVLMSGGIYLNGFVKTLDVLRCGRMEKKKQENGKDTDASTALVIAAMMYFMLYAGGLVLIWKDRQLLLLGIGCIISKTLYSMVFVWFPEAEKGSSPYVFTKKAQKKTLRVILSIILTLCFCTCIAVSPVMGVLESLLCMWIWTYYYYMSKKMFGGITEESAGYFLTLCELGIVLFVGMFGRILL